MMQFAAIRSIDNAMIYQGPFLERMEVLAIKIVRGRILEGAEVLPWGPQPTKTPQGKSVTVPPPFNTFPSA